jgi:hypothetical protein
MGEGQLYIGLLLNIINEGYLTGVFSNIFIFMIKQKGV